MRCPSCQTQCLETDTRCLHCRRILVEAPREERSAANFCGFLFAAFGAAALTFGPNSLWFNENPAIRVGVGGLGGAIVGAIVGLIIDHFHKKPDLTVPVQVPPISRH
jgi:hypothetical protein